MAFDDSTSDDSVLYLLNTSDINENSEDAVSSNESGSDVSFVTAESDESDTSNDRETDQESHQEVDQEAEEEENSAENTSDIEMWSGQLLKSNLPDFDGKLRLSDDIASIFPQYPSPVELFKLFLIPEIITYIVNQSNLYRTQNNLLKQGPMTEDELLLLIGFLYYSSIIPLPTKSDYWSTFCRQPLVADSIARDRMDYLLSILHFNDNTIEKDKVEKVEPLISFFNDRCLNIVYPEQNISIDEQMIGYKGKTAPGKLKQYLPNKPTKRGFKLWARCGISGFVYEVKLYRGATAIASKKIPNTTLARSARPRTTTDIYNEATRAEIEEHNLHVKQFDAAGTVVLDFLKHVPIGSRIFVDNYFGSFKLINKMTDLGYGITCTLRSNRIGQCPIPSEKQMKNKRRGYYQSFVTDDEKTNIFTWKDKKTVLLGSNCVGEEPLVSLNRWDKEEKCYIDVKAPHIVSYYNKNMGGVDLLDMMIALHPIPFRSKKWYIKIIWRIFDLMVVNSWILMNHLAREHGGVIGAGNWRKFRLFSFKNEIAKFLLQKPQVRTSIRFSTPLSSSTPTKSNDAPVSSDDDIDEENVPRKKRKREFKLAVENSLRFDGHNHLSQFISAKNANRCKNQGCKGKTRWICPKCKVHLCLAPQSNCFSEFHTDS